MRRQLLKRLSSVALLALCTGLDTTAALAQECSKKQPIKIVVPYSPGGGTDVLARITADFLQRRLAQAVIVENKGGTSSAIGASVVVKAAPDGYTLMIVAGGDLTAVPAIRSNLPYKFDDFTFIVRGFVSEPLLLASPKLPFSTVPELVSCMKANPVKITLGSPGVGQIVHLGMTMLENAAGVKSLVDPHTGSAQVYSTMMEGTVEITLSTPPFLDTLKVLGPSGHAVTRGSPTRRPWTNSASRMPAGTTGSASLRCRACPSQSPTV